MTEIVDITADFRADEQGLARALAELLHWHCDAEGPTRPDVLLELPPALPETGLGGQAALGALTPSLAGAVHMGHPGFFAHMDPPTPWFAWAATQWSAAFNQNLLHPETAPVARELERRVVDWLAPPFGMDGGHLVPGSSIANLTALWAARELRGVRTVVASEFAHLSINKAARILGLELVLVPSDRGHLLRVDALPSCDWETTALVLTAGTVASGAIDPLHVGIAPAWLHVDAAWAGPLRLTGTYGRLLDGVEQADSVSVSGHKWLFQPKESALVFFRDSDSAHEALSFGGGYLAAPNVGLLGSHGATALPLAVTLLAWGRAGLEQHLEHCLQLAMALAERIADEPTLELWRLPVSGIVLWRPVKCDARAVQAALVRAFVSATEIRGETWLRSVAANPLADPNLVVDDVLAAMRRLEAR
jgi:L-2,4-diaminobutyrate decarboxylase